MLRALYLVRHGESEWNVQRLTQGQTTHPRLTQLGRHHATAAAAVLERALTASPRHPVRLLSSDLVRAVESAAIIGELLGMDVELDPRLREQGLGSLEGRGYDETWAAAARHDWSDPTLQVAGGESVAQLRARIGSVLASLQEPGSTVLVSHGDAIRAALGQLAGTDAQDTPWVEVPNGAVFRVLPGGPAELLSERRGDHAR